jgi:DNA-binding NarL/FixJ family response regulator
MAIKTILVEDIEKIRSSLIPTMQELANLHIVAVAETQAGASEALQQHLDWELVVIDMSLREGSGMDVLREDALMPWT